MHPRGPKMVAAIVAIFVLSISFAGTAAAQQCGSMDVTFIVDETGSMTDVIANIQAQVSKIADEVVKASGGDYQFALLGMPDNNVRVILNFSPNNRQELTTAVGQLATSGGCGGVPYDEAINAVVHGLGVRSGSDGGQLQPFTSKWRAATKIVILITDTLPQAFTCVFTPGVHDVAAHTFAEDAAAAGIHITTVYVPTGNVPEATIIAIMQDVAKTSGGLYKTTKADASDLSDIILDIVNACGGAAGGGGSSNLLIEPKEIVLTNGQTGQVRIINFAPGTTPTNWSIDTGDEGNFTAEFVPVAHPEDPATEEQLLNITVGPNTFQGTHLLPVLAASGATNDYSIVHVIVDCRAPFFYSAGQPKNTTVTSGAKATVAATVSGDGPFKYQWYRGHTGITTFPVAGATSATLTTDAVTASGDYWLRVSNACGSADSATATVSPR